MRLLVTGATGFVGGALVARLGLRPDIDKLYLLIRPSKDLPVAERGRQLVQRLFAPEHQEVMAAKVVALAGEVTKPLMGLDRTTYETLAASVNHVVHAAASTRFVAPLDQLRQDNVGATRETLEFALRCDAAGRLDRYHYVSTSFVAGINSGVATERDLNRGQQFANGYEQTKFESESLVQAHKAKMPATVYRPSIVVGDSATGFTPHFRVLYWPLRLLANNVLPVIPINRGTTIDVVPVDYVAAAMEALMFDRDASGGTFHLTSGRGQEANIRDFILDATRVFGVRRRPMIPFWPFDAIYNSLPRVILGRTFTEKIERARPYRPYIAGHGTYFDSTATRVVLDRLGVVNPKWADYRLKILEYLVETKWGTVNVQPEYVHYSHR